VLAGAIIALSALRAGARVMVALSGEPGKTVTTEGFVRAESAVLEILTSYLGTGTSFGIHRLDETFRNRPAASTPVHILILSDNDIFSSLDRESGGRLGWDVARDALVAGKGGGTFVLELPEYLRQFRSVKQDMAAAETRMRADGWNVSIVTSMEELIDFARRFSRLDYAQIQAQRQRGRHGK
jgi:hypothetical protein